HRQAEPGPSASRSHRPRQRRLRGLRTVRRGGRRRGAVPVVLSRRGDQQPESRGAACASRTARADRGRGRRGMSGEAQHAGIDRPLTLVFAALGGEGGGLLTDWITDACTRAGVLIQTTSIPGVAQRTGATTYYIEMMR